MTGRVAAPGQTVPSPRLRVRNGKHPQYGTVLPVTIWDSVASHNIGQFCQSQYGTVLPATIWDSFTSHNMGQFSHTIRGSFASHNMGQFCYQQIWDIFARHNMGQFCQPQYGTVSPATIWEGFAPQYWTF